eukprot:490282_1
MDPSGSVPKVVELVISPDCTLSNLFYHDGRRTNERMTRSMMVDLFLRLQKRTKWLITVFETRMPYEKIYQDLKKIIELDDKRELEGVKLSGKLSRSSDTKYYTGSMSFTG